MFLITVVTCPPLIDPENGMVTFSQNVGDVATYMCNGGFYLNGSMTRLCQSNGMWSDEAPLCIRKFHQDISHVDQYNDILLTFEYFIAITIMQGGYIAETIFDTALCPVLVIPDGMVMLGNKKVPIVHWTFCFLFIFRFSFCSVFCR